MTTENQPTPPQGAPAEVTLSEEDLLLLGRLREYIPYEQGRWVYHLSNEEACLRIAAHVASAVAEDRKQSRLEYETLMTNCRLAGLKAYDLSAQLTAERTRREDAERRVAALREALKILYDETADYIRINHLGEVHHNKSMQMARTALTEPTAAPSGGPFKYGDKVECRSGDTLPWMQGFYFIAYAPEFDSPYIVKGDLNGHGCSYPIRCHTQCRAAQEPTAAEEGKP
jgi:hypothetical protein